MRDYLQELIFNNEQNYSVLSELVSEWTEKKIDFEMNKQKKSSLELEKINNLENTIQETLENIDKNYKKIVDKLSFKK
jgi:hypothetical protein